MSPRQQDRWRLPSAAAFLAEIESRLADAPVLVVPDAASLPAGLGEALGAYMLDRHRHVRTGWAGLDASPAETLADLLGVEPGLADIANSGLDDILLVDMRQAPLAVLSAEWEIFLSRFRKASTDRPIVPSILLLVPSEADCPGLPLLSWSGRLRRADVTIWADLHAPLNRREPLGSLAAALAVELCGWRLDLAGAIARARDQDLVDPLAWLALHAERSPMSENDCGLNGEPFACPVRLLGAGRREELERRVWRAQLTSIFPWLEDLRQEVIARHRERLSIDAHLRARGVGAVEEMELGSLLFQLAGRVPRSEEDLLRSLARMRNQLAHRLPVATGDLALVLGDRRAPARDCVSADA